MTPKPPLGLKRSGRALWRAVLDDYELDEHELTLLREACRTADALDGLQTLLDNEGLTSTSSQGERVHPALPELRQQRVTFARLLTSLRIPVGDEGRSVPRWDARRVRASGCVVRRRTDAKVPERLATFDGDNWPAPDVYASYRRWREARDVWAADHGWPRGDEHRWAGEHGVLASLPDEPFDPSML